MHNNQTQQLEDQLRQAAQASNFLESDTGKLWVEFVSVEITRLVKEITSEAFLKDHTGYVNAVSSLAAYKKILRKMQLACAPERVQRIKTQLAEQEDLENE